jgi:hypothetical protein
MKSLRLILVLAALSMSACLWRPPPIPPARATPEAGFTGGLTPLEREACERATEANGGSTMISVYVNGRIVNCAEAADSSVPPPADGSVDSATGADASGEAGDAQATHDGAARD